MRPRKPGSPAQPPSFGSYAGCRACTVGGGAIGGFGGGWLEQPRHWLGAQWAGLSSWECRAAQSRRARPEEAQEQSWGTAKGGTLSQLLCGSGRSTAGGGRPRHGHGHGRAWTRGVIAWLCVGS